MTDNLIDYEKVLDSYVDQQWELILKYGIDNRTKKLCQELDKKIERIMPWLIKKVLSDPKK